MGMIGRLASFGICICFSQAKADFFHYNNLVLGDRAIGLGGAYAGVSDDASGIIYNPAGIAFATSNDVSGSANAYYKRNITYEKILEDIDFVEKSEGLVASFFGGVQKLDSIMPRLVAGFAIYSPDSDFKDQNDLLQIPNKNVASFHRAVKQNTSNLKIGLAAAYRVRNNFSIGLGANLINISELSQDYQLSIGKITPKALKKSDGSVLNGYFVSQPTSVYLRTINTFKIKDTVMADKSLFAVDSDSKNSKLSSQAIEPSFGTQYSLGKFVFALTARQGFFVREKLEFYSDTLKINRFSDNSVLASSDLEAVDGLSAPEKYRSATISGSHSIDENAPGGYIEYDSAILALPFVSRFGMAWYPSTTFLWTFDAEYQTKTDGSLSIYNRNSVLNLASGMEYYVLPSVPLRAGFFTNFDSRSKDDFDNKKVAERIDYYGGSFYASWAETSSQFGGGTVVQVGQGKARKLGGDAIQNVKALSYTFAFSASHQL